MKLRLIFNKLQIKKAKNKQNIFVDYIFFVSLQTFLKTVRTNQQHSQ